MIITYLGKQFFKIQQGDLVIAFNPISKASKLPLKASSFGADVAFSTTNHPDYNGIENLSYGDRVPFAITGPGDYETKGLFIKGVMTETELGGKMYINTAYALSIDDISICFLGAQGSSQLAPAAREGLGDPDIVFVPIGGNGVLNALEAYKLALSLSPKLIIPMDYGPEMEKGSLATFLKEAGGDVKPEPKLTLKRKDLDGKEGDVAVLSYE